MKMMTTTTIFKKKLEQFKGCRCDVTVGN